MEVRYLSQYSVLTTVWTIGDGTLAEAKDFSSTACVQTSSEAHPISYPVGTGFFFTM
jgi:hypothetical protein